MVLAVRRRCHFEASARTVCVMLVFTLTLIHAVMVGLCCGRERACFQVEGQAPLKRRQGRSEVAMTDEYLDQERKGSGRRRSHPTRFCNRPCETCDRVETQSAGLTDGHLVKQRESDPVTEETEVRCRGRFPREVEREAA